MGEPAFERLPHINANRTVVKTSARPIKFLRRAHAYFRALADAACLICTATMRHTRSLRYTVEGRVAWEDPQPSSAHSVQA